MKKLLMWSSGLMAGFDVKSRTRPGGGEKFLKHIRRPANTVQLTRKELMHQLLFFE